MRRRRCEMPEAERIPRRPRLRFWRRRRAPVPAHIGFPFDEGGGGDGPPDAGVREPRRPVPTAGAGAIALPLGE